MSLEVDSPYIRALLGGAVAGTTVDLSLYPVDTLKTRLQSAKGFRSSGGFRGVYAGVGSAALGAAPGAALFFVTYESTKQFLRARRYGALPPVGAKLEEKLEPVDHMIAASAGEVTACAVRVPTEVVKQRAQALHFSSSLGAFKAILSLQGEKGVSGVFRELYRGWNITVMREVPFTVIQFPMWEAMKEWRRRTQGRSQVNAFESAVFGSFAGAVAAGITTPLDVLKTRMMLSKEKQQVFSLLSTILRESGPRAFFSGIGPRVLWISAGGFVFLGSYQYTYNLLSLS